MTSVYSAHYSIPPKKVVHNIIVVIVCRAFYRFANFNKGCDVNDSIDFLFCEDFMEGGCVAYIALNKGAMDDGFFCSNAQVIVYERFVARYKTRLELPKKRSTRKF